MNKKDNIYLILLFFFSILIGASYLSKDLYALIMACTYFIVGILYILLKDDEV
jgi:hypothetical protein